MSWDTAQLWCSGDISAVEFNLIPSCKFQLTNLPKGKREGNIKCANMGSKGEEGSVHMDRRRGEINNFYFVIIR